MPILPKTRSKRTAAVVGSGPAGLAAAQQLARAGHETTLFEKDERLGGLLRYGIPDFKLEKHVLDRRLAQMAAEGVCFEPGVAVGKDVRGAELRAKFDAVCLCMGAGEPRRLAVPGAELPGVHFAMDFLAQQNRRVAGDAPSNGDPSAISAKGNTSWSSAAATPAATASARRSAKGPPR